MLIDPFPDHIGHVCLSACLRVCLCLSGCLVCCCRTVSSSISTLTHASIHLSIQSYIRKSMEGLLFLSPHMHSHTNTNKNAHTMHKALIPTSRQPSRWQVALVPLPAFHHSNGPIYLLPNCSIVLVKLTTGSHLHAHLFPHDAPIKIGRLMIRFVCNLTMLRVAPAPRPATTQPHIYIQYRCIMHCFELHMSQST
jgi:hypothetical protein